MNINFEGQTINSYLVKGEVGKGGNASVYECEKDNNKYAIKIISGDIGKTKIKRFKRETIFLRSAVCDYIVKYIDDGEFKYFDNNSGKELTFYYLVMPLMDCSFKEVLKKRDINVVVKIKMLIDVCKALIYAHTNGVIHRDIKPENILVDLKTNKGFLTDFGIAHFKSASNLTKKNDRMANFKYASPEQREIIHGFTTIASDNYSIGLILNEIFTGRIPIGENYTKIVEKNQKLFEIDDIVSQLIKNNPKERTQQLQFVVTNLERIINETDYLEIEAEKNLRYRGKKNLAIEKTAKADVAFVHNAIRKSLYLQNISYTFHDNIKYYLEPLFLNTLFVVNKMHKLISNKRKYDRTSIDKNRDLKRSTKKQKQKLWSWLTNLKIINDFEYIKRDCYDLAYHLTDYHFSEFQKSLEKEYRDYEERYSFVTINELYDLISGIIKDNEWFAYYNFYQLFGIDYSESSAVVSDDSFFLKIDNNNEEKIFEAILLKYNVTTTKYRDLNQGEYLLSSEDFSKIQKIVDDLETIKLNNNELSNINIIDIDDLISDLNNYGLYDEIQPNSTSIDRFGFGLIVRYLFKDVLQEKN